MKKMLNFSLALIICAGFVAVNSFGQSPSPALDLKEASPGIVPAPGPIVPFDTDCDTAPGLIIQDDGSIENGYSGNPGLISEVSIVQSFNVVNPGKLMQVCLTFVSLSGSNLDFELVVFDDDGPGGEPGTELGAMNASITDIPGSVLVNFPWYTVDLSSLDLILDAGNVYIGVRMAPMTFPSRFLAADESGTTPMALGYVKFIGGSGVWETIQSHFFAYRVMLVRPQILNEPPPVPFANWAIFVGIGLIIAFVVVRFRRVF